MMWDSWGHGAWGALWMVFFWALVVGVIVLLVRGIVPGSSRPHELDARDILDERFARGEISAEEYADRKRVLDAHRR